MHINICCFCDFQKSSLDFCGVKEQIETTKAVLEARLTVPGTHSKGIKAVLDLYNSEQLQFAYTPEQLDRFKTSVSFCLLFSCVLVDACCVGLYCY